MNFLQQQQQKQQQMMPCKYETTDGKIYRRCDNGTKCDKARNVCVDDKGQPIPFYTRKKVYYVKKK
jgi:hypothetical protein